MAQEPAGPEAVRALARSWWLLAVTGLLSLIAGVVVILEPSHSLATLAVVAGIFVLIDSIYELVRAVSDRVENRGLSAVMGAIGIVVGILLIRHPIHGVVAVAIVLGIWLVAAGAVRLVLAFSLARGAWSVAAAVIEIIAGIVIVSSPHIGYSALAVVVGLSFILNGIALLGVGWAIRSLASRARATDPVAGVRT